MPGSRHAITLAVLSLPHLAFGVAENFDLLPLGPLPNPGWSVKWQPAPSTQQNLFQVGASNGRFGTQGLSLDTTLAESNYEATHGTGAAGDSYTVSARFRMTIGSSPPAGANHACIGVSLSTAPEWWDGDSLSLYLSRRNNGTYYGITGIGGDSAAQAEAWQVKGWEQNAEIGLPNSLPATTATSDWFTISLTVTPTGANDALGRPLWDVLGEIRNDGDAVVFSHLVEDRVITDRGNDPDHPDALATFVPGQTLYGSVKVPWVNSGSYLTLAQGQVVGLDVDDFSLTAANPSPILPVHGLTTDPTTQDLDGNGLPDLWEAIYGGPGIDPLADSDGDGVPNGVEAGFGTDPFDPDSAPSFQVGPSDAGDALLRWRALDHRSGAVQTSTDLNNTDPWAPQPGTPVLSGNEWQLTLPTAEPQRFYRLMATENDGDGDGVADWIEPLLGFSNAGGSADSASLPQSYDTTGDDIPDVTLSGDLSAFNEIYRRSAPGTRLTRAQAARLLLQASFGPSTTAEVEHVARIGAEAWINEQIALPPTLTSPYILAIKNDWSTGAADPNLAGYASNETIVFGNNFMTPWARNAIGAPDQLRQRVAWALSQILVTSRGSAMLANQPQAIAHYYDLFINQAFGNYGTLLLDVSLSPVMGNYLSHLGNRKADVALLRFPDENYAREIMQLFSIGLWELNMDGSRKTDGAGEPIPTYGNPEITELARVFTGTNYASAGFGGGWRDDGFYMTTPMKVFASEHDFGAKLVVTGNGTTHTIPARSATDANALQDVEDAVRQLVLHPNTAPFISRQLIQFLVTSNPTPQYVQRVATVFADNGGGVAGDLEAVVRAILLDEEARDPLRHLGTAHFGQLREPAIRTMHLARMLKLGDHPDLLWWDWGTYQGASLQEPMHSPSVFNFYRPDFRLFGQLAENGLDSPAFGITDSYSAISFPNHLWNICKNGFKTADYDYPEDLSELESLAGNIPALLDHLSLLYCGGTLGADNRAIITTALAAEGNLTERARLAAYLVLMSPEGTCLK